MNDHIGKNNDEFDSVCERAMIRCEATFHPAPGFEYLDTVPCGESEPVAMAPSVMIDAEFAPNGANYRLEDLFERPRMMCPDIENLRDLLFFAKGVCCGQSPVFGGGYLGSFPNYLSHRFQLSSNIEWTTILLREYGDRPFLEACGAILELFRDWRASKH